eukprot:SAG31_NODE_4121_length_3562_cov_5.914525_2_plen_123_part_00
MRSAWHHVNYLTFSTTHRPELLGDGVGMAPTWTSSLNKRWDYVGREPLRVLVASHRVSLVVGITHQVAIWLIRWPKDCRDQRSGVRGALGEHGVYARRTKSSVHVNVQDGISKRALLLQPGL